MQQIYGLEGDPARTDGEDPPSRAGLPGLEPGTLDLEGRRSIRLSYRPKVKCQLLPASRGGGIRTHDLLLPKQARYRAAPRPE